jgi:hypothetical protein
VVGAEEVYDPDRPRRAGSRPCEWKGAQSLEAAIADPVRGQDTTLHDPALLNGKKRLSPR